MLDREFKYYIENQDMLVSKHNGQHIVIVEENVIGAFESVGEAFTFALENGHKPGSFMIQLCGPGVENYTMDQHRVAFC